MATLLVDSDVVIDHLKRRSPTIALLDHHVNIGDVLATNVVVVADVFSGLGSDERSTADRFFNGLFFLETTPLIARTAGDLRYVSARKGIRLGLGDALIAATVLYYGASVVTGNVRHYQQMAVPIIPIPRQTR